jgi:hypothetical protein
MAKHIHAETMAQYAQDALESETPWQNWEYTYNKIWKPLAQHPSWDLYVCYRRKPTTQIINGIEVPCPMTVWPKRGASCFYPDITVEKFYGWFDWQDHEYSSHEYSRRLFDRGLIFENEEDAITVAKAMLGILNTVDDPEPD